MPVWLYTIPGIHGLIIADQENETPEHAQRVAQGIAQLLRRDAPGARARLGEYVGDRLSDFVVEFELVTDVQELNYTLEDLYDFCDDERIWLDFSEAGHEDTAT